MEKSNKASKKQQSPKKGRRSRTKFPALKPELNLRSRYELIDYDYVDKLSDKDKEWLNTFSEEYINANFNHGKKILHKTQPLKKNCYDRNNARNRDILTRAKAAGDVLYLEEIKETEKGLKEYLDEVDDSKNLKDTNDNTDSDT